MLYIFQPSTDVNDIHFLLWTPENPSAGDEQMLLFGDADSIVNSNFDPSRPTKVIIYDRLLLTAQN